jgi:hypothetical protein
MLRGGEGGVLTFGEIGNDASTGGWFTPVRKTPPQNLDSGQHAREADFGGPTWFTPKPQAAEPPAPGGGPDRGRADFHWAHHGQGLDGQDPRGPGGAAAWREIPARGVTAANRWAEVTRGGTPAGINPSRRGDDVFPPNGFPPSGFPTSLDLSQDDDWALGADQGMRGAGRPGERHGGFGEAAPADVPFRGARPIDLSERPGPTARRGPAYSPAAASVAPSTTQRRQETGALRRIKESGAMRVIMDTGAMRALMDTTAMQMLRERYAGKGKALAIGLVCFWVVVAVAATLLLVKPGG